MQGMIYGIGVGPGDPELMTLKAARLLREVDVIAIPGKKRRRVPHIRSLWGRFRRSRRRRSSLWCSR